jgi:hypothetical protein
MSAVSQGRGHTESGGSLTERPGMSESLSHTLRGPTSRPACTYLPIRPCTVHMHAGMQIWMYVYHR